MSKPVLIASDLTSRSDRALGRAQLLGNALILAHVVAGEERLTDKARARLHAIACEDLDDAQLVSEVLIVSGSVPDTLARLAAERGCALIATGIASFDSPKDYILGTTVDFLVRRASVPVLIAKRKLRHPYRSLIVATDFSSCSRRALEAATRLFPEAQIRLLHACTPPFPSRLDPDEMTPYVRDEREREMRTFVAALPSDMQERIESEIEVGSLAGAIEERRAAGRCDLLVLGTHGRGGFVRAAIGSRASELLTSSLSDVLWFANCRLRQVEGWRRA